LRNYKPLACHHSIFTTLYKPGKSTQAIIKKIYDTTSFIGKV
jgi:hypothetical protein